MTGQSPPAVEGQSAALRGEPPSSCPYAPGTREGRQWHLAWVCTENDRQDASGEAATRTAEQKAEARRLAEMWEPRRYAPNPVDELCREVAEVSASPSPMEAMSAFDDFDDPAVAARSWSPPSAPLSLRVEERWDPAADEKMILVNFGDPPVATFVNQHAREVTALIGPAGWRLTLGDPVEPAAVTMVGRVEPAARRPDPAAARKRHGAAAVCPRHGPTKGGLCRRCAR